jgi:uncharacterized protein DUF6152
MQLLERYHMNGKLFLIFVLLAGLASSSSPLLAHHSTAEYDMDKSASVAGTVTQFAWNNPHVYIYLDVKNSKGEIEKWSGELGAISMLSRINWRRDTVKPGDQVTMFGNRAMDGRFLMRVTKITFRDGQELLGVRAP